MKKFILGFLLVVFVMLTGIGCGFLTATMNTKPDMVNDLRPPATSTIYDANGNVLTTIHGVENRIPVKIAQVPRNLQDAFIAVEDNRFYEHSGVDPRSILRAAWANIRGHAISEGGSTITQQLAKNAYLTQERTLKRKVQEVFLALELEKQYTKQEILELYLNQIYFGQGAYGVQAAAKTYFNKNVEDLDLNECALLAGIPKSPNYYSPFNNLQASNERKGVVLDQMAKYGYITRLTAAETKVKEVKLYKPEKKNDSSASYFIDYVTGLLVDKFGADAVYKEGLKIYTTLDMDMQRAAEAAMKNLPDYRTDENGMVQPQGALVAIDPRTGYIKAMVGGRGTDQFNRATMAERQPGSAFKPFVFAAALENKFSPDTLIDDSPLKIGDWQPQNYNRTFNGKVKLRYVAEQSLNVPVVKIAQKLGMEKPIYYAQEMGISTFVLEGARNDRNLATSIGGMTRGVTPLELTSAYGTFANKGVHISPVAIIEVLDRDGKVIDQANPTVRSAISEASAADLTDILQGVIKRGTGTRANIGRPAAGKTGTTDSYADAWFVGYTPELVAGVWIGNDDNASMGVMTGGMTPAVIWKAFMQTALKEVPVRNFDGAAWRGGTIAELPEDGKKKQTPKENKTDKKDSAGGQNNKKTNEENSGAGNTPAPNSNNNPPASKETPTENEPAQAETASPAQAPQQEPEPVAQPPTPGADIGKDSN